MLGSTSRAASALVLLAAGKHVPLELDATVRVVDGELEVEDVTHADHRELGITWSPLGILRAPSKLIVRGRSSAREAHSNEVVSRLRDRAPPAVGAYRQRIARREALARRASRPGGARAERARPGARRQGLEHSAGPRWLQQSDRRIPERWQTPAFPQAAVCTQQARKARGGPATSLTRGQLQESTGIDVEHARSRPADLQDFPGFSGTSSAGSRPTKSTMAARKLMRSRRRRRCARPREGAAARSRGDSAPVC